MDFLVSGYAEEGSSGVRLLHLHESSGTLSGEMLFSDAVNPSWMIRHPAVRTLFYAVQETEPAGAVSILRLEGDRLAILRQMKTGASPCHIALDPDAGWMAVSNYGDGTLDVFSLDHRGMISGHADHVAHHGRGPDPSRQEGPHVHAALSLNGQLFCTDLGLDKVFIYQADHAGKLHPDGWIPVPAASGPRHLAVHPDHPGLLYLITEMGGFVCVIDLRSRSVIQQRGIIPETYHGAFYASAVGFCGNTLYAASRECDVIALFSLTAAGTLSLPSLFPHPGKWPRDVRMEGPWCLTADSVSETVTLLRRRGPMLEKCCTVPVPGLRPSCILPLAPE